MKFTVVHPGELGPSELDRWRQLQRTDPVLDDPYLSPEFTQAVGRVLDHARVAVLEDPTDGIVGFLPFERHALGVGQPIGAELLGTQALIHAPGLEVNLRDLLRGCGLTVWEFTDLLPTQTLFAGHVKTTAPCPVIDLSDGYDGWVAQRPRRATKLVKDLEANARRMGRELGAVTFTYRLDPADPAAGRALAIIMRWKSDQYRRTGRSDRFAMPWMVALLEELARTTAPGCTGVLSMLVAGDRPVAGHFGLASRRRLVHMFPAYDRAVRRYSPGLVLNLRLTQAAAADGLAEVSLGRGDFDYKQRFKSHDVTLGQGWVQRPSTGAAIRWARREPVRHLTNLIVGNPRLRHAADQTLRRIGSARSRLVHAPTGPDPTAFGLDAAAQSGTAAQLETAAQPETQGQSATAAQSATATQSETTTQPETAPAEPGRAALHPAESRQSEPHQSDPRQGAPRPADAQPAVPHRADPRPAASHQAAPPAADSSPADSSPADPQRADPGRRVGPRTEPATPGGAAPTLNPEAEPTPAPHRH